MQKQVSKILFILFLVSQALFAVAVPEKANLSAVAASVKADQATSAQADLSAGAVSAQADSLYSGRQYTQAFELYHSLYLSGHYSPAMLLKMAFIQEGLGHLGESLYYLNLYYLATDDPQALKKMEELAKKNNLEGYETDETIKAIAWLQEQYTTLAWGIASFSILLLAIMFYQRVKKKMNPSLTGLLLVFTLALLFAHINYSLSSERGIVAQPQTYLMSGPSAGASVIAIVGEGHQLEIKGKEDVWLKVEWKNGEVWVKEGAVREVRL